jgi:hypothetical protein
MFQRIWILPHPGLNLNRKVENGKFVSCLMGVLKSPREQKNFIGKSPYLHAVLAFSRRFKPA